MKSNECSSLKRKLRWREIHPPSFFDFTSKMALSESDKAKFKKWLARGELTEILDAFGEAQYKNALQYIAKKYFWS